MSTLKIKGHIWIENGNGHVIGPGGKELLEAIRKSGSIKSAAKTMQMSYRHAWEMLSSMNKISSKPLIEKSAGGFNGGGTCLTKEGERLISIYENLTVEFTKFKKQLNEII